MTFTITRQLRFLSVDTQIFDNVLVIQNIRKKWKNRLKQEQNTENTRTLFHGTKILEDAIIRLVFFFFFWANPATKCLKTCVRHKNLR